MWTHGWRPGPGLWRAYGALQMGAGSTLCGAGVGALDLGLVTV